MERMYRAITIIVVVLIVSGKGQGVFSAESGMAAWTGEGIGRMTPSGIKWRGAIFGINWQIGVSK